MVFTEEEEQRLFRDVDDFYKKQTEALFDVADGGVIRAARGELVEKIVDIVCNSIREKGHNIVARVGDSDLQTITISSADASYSKKHQVDRHIWVNDSLEAVVECKSYLDSCYYERACNDFKIMKIKHPNVKCYILSLEDSIGDESRIFTDAIFGNICNGIYHLCNGKRSSAKPIYRREYYKPIQQPSLVRFIRSICSLVR